MRALRQRVSVGAVRGADDVPLLKGLANAHRDCLLPDGNMEEAGQLARAEALLDLLLKAADEEHLPEELLHAL
jgi:hypothetical protein